MGLTDDQAPAMTTSIPRRVFRASVAALGLVVVLAGPMVLADFDQPRPPALSAAQKERLKERDKLSQQAKTLRAHGKRAEAIQTAEAMLAIEREVLGRRARRRLGH